MAVSAAVLALALAAASQPLAGEAVAAAGCAGVEGDFNGDGTPDTAVADTEAAVGGATGAGVVHVVYGGGAGTLELTQEAAKAGPSEKGDRFGFAMATYDADLDGCADLAIGTPYEDIGTAADSGRVVVVHGSPAGLGAGRTTVEYVQQTAPLATMAAEAGDWMGYAVEAGKTAQGVPFLVVGIPGEDIGTSVDAGGFVYFSGSTTVTAGVVNQDTATAGAVPDAVESYDRFGETLVATPNFLAVGSPGEAEGSYDQSGAVTVFNHTLTSGAPKPLSAITQNSADVAGACETGDGFGTALAAVTPLTPAGSGPKMLLAVGIPGEDLTLAAGNTVVDAGAVQVFSIDSAGAHTETAWIDQNVADVEDLVEAGDHFGRTLTAHMGNKIPHLAVGVPGQDAGGVLDRGAVQLFLMYEPTGATDVLLEPGGRIPAPEGAAGLYTGLSLGSSPAGLVVGTPYGPAEGHAAHLFPWPPFGANWGAAPSKSFRPGQDGLPAGDSAFGTVVR
ncbi:VCBS repeat-containing protein [Streptomyces termitum]|uniref:VCBS repeat-containing protein n=1 Tax=Streptomyces termitum TaxID=67368 RepID=UPI00379D15DB